MSRALGLLALLLATLTLFPISTAYADDPFIKAEAALSEPTLRVGDQIGLRISITHHVQTRVLFPDLRDKLGGLEVIRSSPEDVTRYPNGTQVTVFRYVITGFVPGKYALPPITADYIAPDGTQGEVITNGLSAEIVSVLTNPETEQLRDIKPPVEIPRLPIPYARIVATVMLALATIGLLMIAILRLLAYQPPRVLRPAPPARPEVAARTALARLARREIRTAADMQDYFTGISLTIRTYLDQRFRLDAAASTTAELRRVLIERELDPWQARIITGLLEECDASKWAHYQPDKARAARALTMALEIVDLTTASGDASPPSGYYGPPSPSPRAT